MMIVTNIAISPLKRAIFTVILVYLLYKIMASPAEIFALTQGIYINDNPVNRKIFLLIFNPIIESQGGIKLTILKNWNNPDDLTNRLLPLFPQMSNSYLFYTVTIREEYDRILPKPDGYQYTDETYLACINGTGQCHNPDIIDYNKLFTDYNVCAKNVDEVWLWGAPYFGYFEYNPVNYCGRTIYVMGFNYERGLGEALHDFGHRMEYVGINRVGDGGGWAQNEANQWNKFSLINGHCGNIHYPPGTIPPIEEYIYDKTQMVLSDCDGYLNYPFGPFTVKQVNCAVWNCSQDGFVKWWLSHIPHLSGTYFTGQKYIYNNWWKYYVYFDETIYPIITPTISPSCPDGVKGNINCDSTGLINEIDYSLLIGRWSPYGPVPTPILPTYRSADLNSDGKVDEADVSIVVRNWRT